MTAALLTFVKFFSMVKGQTQYIIDSIGWLFIKKEVNYLFIFERGGGYERIGNTDFRIKKKVNVKFKSNILIFLLDSDLT